MQKILKSVCAVMVLCITMCSVKFVSAAETAGVSAGTAEGMPGDTVDVTFSMSQNPGTTMYEFYLEYDRDALSVVSVENGDVYSEWYPADIEKYPLYIGAGDALALENITEDAILATVRFKIADDAEAGEYRFKIQDGIFLNAELKDYEMLYDDTGCITVKMEKKQSTAKYFIIAGGILVFCGAICILLRLKKQHKKEDEE